MFVVLLENYVYLQIMCILKCDPSENTRNIGRHSVQII